MTSQRVEELLETLTRDDTLRVERAAPGSLEAEAGEACRIGDVEKIQQLLDAGLSPEARDKQGRTLLNAAAGMGHIDVVRLLLDRGAKVDTPSVAVLLELIYMNSQAIHAATSQNNFTVVELLLDRGADPNARVDTESLYSYFQQVTPAHQAASRGHTQILRLLVARGADPNLTATIRVKALPRPYLSGCTALHLAAFTHQLPVIKFCIQELKMDPNAADKETGAAPLHAAVPLGDTSGISYLVQLGANINAKMVGPDGNGWTPLHLACMLARTQTMRLLVLLGAETRITDDSGLLPEQLIRTPELRAVFDMAVKEREKALAQQAAGAPAAGTASQNIRSVDLHEIESIIDNILLGGSGK